MYNTHFNNLVIYAVIRELVIDVLIVKIGAYVTFLILNEYYYYYLIVDVLSDHIDQMIREDNFVLVTNPWCCWSEAITAFLVHCPFVYRTDDEGFVPSLGLTGKVGLFANHAAEDAASIAAASRRHDRDFLHDVNNKLVSLALIMLIN